MSIRPQLCNTALSLLCKIRCDADVDGRARADREDGAHEECGRVACDRTAKQYAGMSTPGHRCEKQGVQSRKVLRQNHDGPMKMQRWAVAVRVVHVRRHVAWDVRQRRGARVRCRV